MERWSLGRYDLSPDAAGVLGAAAGALAGALVLLDDEVDDDEEDDDDEPPPSFFVEPYRSEYQPPPLRWKLERLTCLLSEPWAPHAVQAGGVGSDIFCRTSMVFPQAEQPYS